MRSEKNMLELGTLSSLQVGFCLVGMLFTFLWYLHSCGWYVIVLLEVYLHLCS